MASISEPFIRRPVGTTLLAIGLFLIGIVAYVFLPVSAVPNVDFPMIRVSAIAAGRRSVGDGGDRRRAAGTAARRDRRASSRSPRPVRSAPPASSCNSPSAATSTAPRATCRRRSTPRWPICRATCRHCRDSAKPIPAAAPVFVLALTSKTHLDQRDVRRRRYRDRAAHLAGAGRRRSHRQRRRPAGGADCAQSGGAVECGDRDRRRPARHHQCQSAGAGRHLQRRPPERDDFDQPADAHRGRIPRHHDQELERQFRPALRCRRGRGSACATAARSPGSTSSRRC